MVMDVLVVISFKKGSTSDRSLNVNDDIISSIINLNIIVRWY